MSTTIETWFYRFAALFWMGMLSLISAQPGSKVHVDPPIDKVIHLCVFGVLGYLLALGTGPKRRWHAIWIAPLLVAICGGLDEFHQSFSPGRSMSIGDWLCDTAGGIAAGVAWILAWSQGLRSKRTES